MKFVILALLATTILTQQQKPKCPVNCIGCARLTVQESLSQRPKPKVQYKCSGCLYHYTQGNGCSADSGVKDQNCAVWQNGNHCVVCKPGYLVKKASVSSGLGQQQSKSCYPTAITGCEYGYLKGGKPYCLACKKGIPDKTFGKCQAARTGLAQGRRPQLPANCDWGSATRKSGVYSTGCFKCNTGYAVNVSTRQCVATNLTGCLSLSPLTATQCQTCNFFFGYYNKYPGICTI